MTRALLLSTQDLLDQDSMAREHLSIPDCFQCTNPSDVEVRGSSARPWVACALFPCRGTAPWSAGGGSVDAGQWIKALHCCIAEDEDREP